MCRVVLERGVAPLGRTCGWCVSSLSVPELPFASSSPCGTGGVGSGCTCLIGEIQASAGRKREHMNKHTSNN